MLAVLKNEKHAGSARRYGDILQLDDSRVVVEGKFPQNGDLAQRRLGKSIARFVMRQAPLQGAGLPALLVHVGSEGGVLLREALKRLRHVDLGLVVLGRDGQADHRGGHVDVGHRQLDGAIGKRVT